MISVLFGKYRRLESQLANRGCGITDVAEVVEAMGVLLMSGVIKIKLKKSQLTLNEIAWCSSYPRSTTGSLEARQAEASVNNNTATILTPAEQNKNTGKRGPLELPGLY